MASEEVPKSYSETSPELQITQWTLKDEKNYISASNLSELKKSPQRKLKERTTNYKKDIETNNLKNINKNEN